MADLFGFLGVDPTFVPETGKRHAQTGEIPNPVLRFAWTKTVRVRTFLRPRLPRGLRDAVLPALARELAQPPLDPALRGELVEVFRDDVERLEGLIERDLSHWRA